MPRRRVNVRVQPEVIEGLCKPSFPGTYTRTDAGLPADAKMVGCGYDWERNQFFLVFEHDSFPEVQDGELVPDFGGVQLSAIHVPEKIDGATVAMLEGLTQKQVERHQSDMTALAVDGARWGTMLSGIRPVLLPHFEPEADMPKFINDG